MLKQSTILASFYDSFEISNYNKPIKFLIKMDDTEKDAWYYSKMAECYYELRKYKIAVDYCRKSLEIQDKYPLALWTLGNSLYYLKKYNESVEIFSKILNMTEFEIGKIETRLGILWARSLRMDSYLRTADNLYMLCKDDEAKEALLHFNLIRKKGVKSCLHPNQIKAMRQKINSL